MQVGTGLTAVTPHLVFALVLSREWIIGIIGLIGVIGIMRIIGVIGVIGVIEIIGCGGFIDSFCEDAIPC